MKLSIIIPVYNSDKYLSKCLESVFDQDLKVSDFEVIVINDGSTDESEQIILRYVSLRQNLVYLKQTNKGVSVARNAGLEVSKGEYITFVDSDDQIQKDSLKVILNRLLDDNLDILYPVVYTYSENEEQLGEIGFHGEYDEIKKGILQDRRTFPPTFYRREILSGIRFNQQLSFGEDTVFNAKAQAISQRVSFCNIPYYKYFRRPNSLSRQEKTARLFNGLITAILDIREFQNQNFGHTEEATEYFNNAYKIFVNIIIGEFLTTTYDLPKFRTLVKMLREQRLQYMLPIIAERYPYIDKSYIKFTLYRKYTSWRVILEHLVNRAKNYKKNEID